jgi:hypothetical protein
MSPEEIESWFPHLKEEGWRKTSEESDEYNCIAFAANDTGRKWDPDESAGRHWPDEVPRTLELSSFIALFEMECGFSKCESIDERLEDGIEKIAIYCNFNPLLKTIEVTHAARQLPSGKWTSKLGDWDDIEHNTLKAVSGSWPAYGTVKQVMRKPRNVEVK